MDENFRESDGQTFIRNMDYLAIFP